MKKKALSVWLALLLVAAVFSVIFAGTVSALNNDHNLSGIVYESDGSNPTVPTDFAVWVEHWDGMTYTWFRFPTTGFIQTQKGTSDDRYWYSFVLPNEEKGTTWDSGDQYKIHVDGSPWGEYNGNTTSNGTGSAGDPFPPLDPTNPASGVNTINHMPGGGYGNEQQWDIRTVAPIDLVPYNVTANGIPHAPPAAIPAPPNVDVPIFWNVTNVGSVPSGPFYISLWECNNIGVNNPVPPIDEFLHSSLDGGQDSGVLSRYWHSPAAPGDYYVNLTVDSQYDVTEFDEANNRVILHFIVGPELNFKEVFVDGNTPSDPIFVGPNSSVDIIAVVQNTGPSATGGPSDTFTVTIYNITGLGGSRIPGTEIHVVVNTLDSMEETVPALLWTWYTPSTVLTDVWVNISIDFYDDVWEADETNNEFTLHFNVPPTPVTSIQATSPVVLGPTWYIDSTTDLFFNVGGSYPPFTVNYRIIDQFTLAEVEPWGTTTQGTLFDLSGPGEGTYKVEFYSVDSINNTEISIKNKIIIVDDTPPTTSINFASPRYRDSATDNWNITSQTPAILTAVDNPTGWSAEPGFLNGSGIGVTGIITDIYYQVEKVFVSGNVMVLDWTQATIETEVDGVYTALPFTFDPAWADEDMLYSINCYSIDNLGHTGSTVSTIIYLDNTPPTKILDYGAPYYRENAATDMWNITSASEISITSDDGAGSGVNNTQYRVWGPGQDTAWVVYSAPFTISSSWNDGVYTIEYNSTDNLGNENTRTDDFYLDNTGPDSTISADPSVLISTTPLRYEVNASTIFTISADDHAGSGVQTDGITYWLAPDSQTTFIYDPAMTYNYTGSSGLFPSLTPEQKVGNQTIRVYSIDNLGNVGPEAELNIYLEEDIIPPNPPVLKIFKNGDHLRLEWEYPADKPDDIEFYKIYESTTIEGLALDSFLTDTKTANDGGIIPLRNSYNHTGAAADDSDHYYMITAVDTKANEGYTSNIVGKVTLTFTSGYNTFGLPLEPFEVTTATEMITDEKFTDDRDTIYRYDIELQNWVGRPKDMPSSIDEFTLEFGEGYMIYVAESEVKYSFTGAAGTAIRFKKEVVGDQSVFRESLTATHSNGNIILSWSPDTTASGYNIYMGTKRFGTGSLNDFDIDKVNTGAVTTTTYTITMGTETELYFLVVALDAGGLEGASTFGVGAREITYSEGYSLVSLELDPKPQAGAGFFATNMFNDESGTLYYYDKENGEWTGHPRDLPENINNIVVNIGSAYIVYVDAGDVSYVYTGV